MTAAQARERFAAARVARLATSGEAGPHVVPVVFAVAGDTVFMAVDAKPKRTMNLKRLANVRHDPRVALLADHYDDADWSALWWVRADGTARILDPDDPEAEVGIAHLVRRYPQYETAQPRGPVLRVAVERWSGWHG